MTIAYWCVFIFIWFPYITLFFSKIMAGDMSRMNHDPRSNFASKSDMSKRLYNAHFNTIEMIGPFAAAVIIAHLVGQLPQSTMDNLAIAFVVSRIFYVLAYAIGWAPVRTIIWLLGVILVFCYFILPLF